MTNLPQVKSIYSCESVETVLWKITNIIASSENCCFMYHCSEPFGSMVGANVEIQYFGFSKEWIQHYGHADVRRFDPFVDQTMRLGTAIRWKDALSAMTLTDPQKGFVQLATQFGIISPTTDVLSIPLFGPNGWDAYCAFSFGRNFEPSDTPMAIRLVSVWQIAHNRIVQLRRANMESVVSLSHREKGVLLALSRGQSLGNIAESQCLSRATVDTYVRRLYGKLNVRDRIGAVLTGVRLGLVNF